MNNSNPQENDFSKLRNKAEGKLKQRGTKPAKGTHADLEHELNVHEIELQMQNLELIATQERLTAALKEYEELFELSPVGYFILDKNSLIKKVNKRGCVQLGLNKAQLIGKPFSTFIHTEFHQDNFYRHKNLVIEEGTLELMECEIEKKDGPVFSALIKSTIVNDEQSSFKHLLSMVNDVTHIKEHEHEVETALIKEKELNELKSRFIAMASHEFRTPLSAVLSSTALVERYAQMGQDEQMHKHLSRIKASIKDLVSILDEFLSIEKLESGKVEITRRNFNLPEFCEDVVEEVRSIMRKGQNIIYKHIGDEEIKEDKIIIQHVLLNLLSNACKYSGEDKEINLSTMVTDNKISMKIKDNGIGIPEDEQNNIFSRFFRAQNAVAIQGTGLGLNIVKRYVELINGTIDFTSKTNEGTTFTVELPKISCL